MSIDNLRNEIDDYAKKVIDLDSNLDIQYRAWENAENVDVMEQMKELMEGENTAISQLNIFLTVLSWKYNEQEYENIAQLLQTDENGTFEFEKLLEGIWKQCDGIKGFQGQYRHDKCNACKNRPWNTDRIVCVSNCRKERRTCG